MVQLTFALDGREMISADALRKHSSVDPVERAMLLAIGNHIRRRLRALSCLHHAQWPHVIASGPSADRLIYSVEGCCQRLVDDATGALDLEQSRELPLAS